MCWGGNDKQQDAPQPPAAPDPAAADNKAKEEIEAKRKRRSKTILTSAQGVLGGADTERKSLLGQ